MSLDSWVAECYPVPADETEESEACVHSLRKWEGALPAMLEKHGVEYRDAVIDEVTVINEVAFIKNRFSFDASTCALCFHYINHDLEIEDFLTEEGGYSKLHRKECEACPLAIVRGGVPCDAAREDEDGSPYLSKPEVMVKWLKLAVQWEKDHGNC